MAVTAVCLLCIIFTSISHLIPISGTTMADRLNLKMRKALFEMLMSLWADQVLKISRLSRFFES